MKKIKSKDRRKDRMRRVDMEQSGYRRSSSMIPRDRWWRGERGRGGDVPMMVGVRVLVPSVEDEKMKGVRSASASPNPPGRT